jgi:hypothetical protein
MYELIVDVRLYFFNSQELSSDGHINMLVTGNTLPVADRLPVTSNCLPVTDGLPITSKPKRPVTGKPFCSSVLQLSIVRNLIPNGCSDDIRRVDY